MRISFSATNPCHVFDMARELYGMGELGVYYSGYPRWKLDVPGGFPLRANSWRTLAVYGLLRVPRRLRPADRDLFLFQDAAFDRWAARVLEPCDFIHGIPGQCRSTFESARRLGVATVLNHATGPVRQWVETMRSEYRRVGLDVERVSPYDAGYFRHADDEYRLADYHCAASTVVRDQLVAEGVDSGRIWVVPYAADSGVFHARGAWRSEQFRIVFAGQFGLRKGIASMLQALDASGDREWSADVYGDRLPEASRDLEGYGGGVPLRFHGAVSRERLAEVFRRSSVLVLPSLEEGFGLVVPQALACGLPCIVSDRVGAKDLVCHRVNGSVVPVGDADALLGELEWWAEHPAVVDPPPAWRSCAERLLGQSHRALTMKGGG